MRRLSFSSLRVRLILLVFLATAPVLGLMVYDGIQRRGVERVWVLENARQLAQGYCNLLERIALDARQTVFFLSQLPESDRLEPDFYCRLFSKLLERNEIYTGLSIFKPNGVVIASVPPFTKPTSFGDRPYFQRLLQSRDFVIGEYQVGRISGKPNIVLACPDLDATGQIRTVLTAGVDLRFLQKALLKNDLPSEATLTVVDSDGRILVRFPDSGKFIGKEMPEEFIVNAMLTKRDGVKEGSGLDGEDRLFGFATFGKGAESLFVCVGIPERIAFAEADQNMRRNLTLLGILSIIALSAAVFVGNVLVHSPVNRLVKATKQLTSGDLTSRAGYLHGSGEIAQLGRAFDEMAESLQRRETERKEAEGALRLSEERYRLLVENVFDVIFSVDREFKIISISQSVERVLGYKPEELADRPLQDLNIIAPAYVETAISHTMRVLGGEKAPSSVYEFITKSGEKRFAEISSVPLFRDGKVEATISVARDITDKRVAEEKLRKVNRTLEMLSDCNQALVRAKREDELLENICRVIAQKGGYPLAWIGYKEQDEEKTLRPVAQAGDDKGYLETVRITWADTDLGQNPAGRAIRTGEPIMVQDILTDPSFPHWRAKAMKHGYAASIALPLNENHNTFGSLNIYGNKPGAFDPKEVDLLKELANDLAYGIRTMRTRAERDRLDAQFRRLAENAHDLIYRYDLTPRRGFTYINPAVATITGYTPEEYYADPELRSKVVHPEDRPLLSASSRGGFPSGEPLTLRWVHKDGTLIWIQMRRVPVYDDDGNLIAVEGIGRDITERKRAEEALAESEQRFRGLFENMSSGVAVYQAVDGGADFVFKDFNAAAARMEQTPRDTVIGRRVTELFPGVGPMGLLDVFHRVWKTGTPEHHPVTFYTDEKHAGWRENYVYRLRSGEIVAIFDDMTARKQAEEALQRSEKYFRALIENGSDLITEIDTQGIIRYQSPSIERELGYLPEEMVGRSVFDFIHPDDISVVSDTMAMGIGDPGKIYAREVRFRHRDGSWRVLEAAGKFVTNPEGFTGVIVNSRDITERKRAEEALKESEEKYRTVLESIEEAYIEVDVGGNFIFFNDALPKILGYTKDELVGMNNRHYMPPESSKKMYGLFNEMYRTGNPIKKVDFEVIRKDGKRRFHEMSASLLRDKGGRPIGFRGVSHDITERKTAEEALRESEEKYRTILDSIEEAYFETDVRGNFTFFNDALSKILGYTKDELVGVNYLKYTPPESAKIIHEAFNKMYRTGRPVKKVAYEVIRKDGKRGFHELSAFLLRDKAGQPIGFRGVEHDITDRKLAEEALLKAHEDLERKIANRTAELRIAKEAADAASRAKSDFLASMSHELRTPLNAIIGFSEVLQDRYFGELNEKQADYVNDILESGKHLLSLISDILDLSKIEAGKLELELSVVHVKELLENSVRMIREKCMKHGIDLRMNIAQGLDSLEITADERRLKQVMFNLLSNAAKFTSEGGAITVAAEQKGGLIVISVEDTGIGIALGNQEKIFEEFYQVKGSAVDKTPGTGLGLPLTRRLVEMHGGEVWVESEGEGKGSKFSFTLPLIAERTEEISLPEAQRAKVLRNHLMRIISLAKRKGRGFAFCSLQAQAGVSEESLSNLKKVLQKDKRGYDFLGMDESGHFYLILQESALPQSHAVCERMIKAAEGKGMGLKISYAVAIYPEDGGTPEELMKKVHMPIA
jgi:PAS domain S-box-containing protein